MSKSPRSNPKNSQDRKPDRPYPSGDSRPQKSRAESRPGKPKESGKSYPERSDRRPTRGMKIEKREGGTPDFDRPFPLGDRKVSGPFRKKGKPSLGNQRVRIPRTKPTEGGSATDQGMTLNKYIAHSDQCSRREAAEWVKQGKVKVNGVLELNPGYRVQLFDEVSIAGKKLKPSRNRVYVLLNKPKGFITTTDDPEGRPTVMDLVQLEGGERLYPVGRLDRNTTGLLLLTNDGDLAQRLSHPSYEIRKVYQVEIDKPLARADFEKIREGMELPDGPVTVDEIAYLDKPQVLGLEIHSGRNRIVRRIFEAFGYEVLKLDRVMYAGLTKKNLPRGRWRHLEAEEVIYLKHFSKPRS